LNPHVLCLVLTLILQKRRQVDYGSDEEELERMTAVGGGSNPEEGDEVEQEAPPSIMGQSKSHDRTSEIGALLATGSNPD